MIHCYIEKKSFTLNGFRHAIPIVKYHKNATFLQTKKKQLTFPRTKVLGSALLIFN